MFLVNSDDRLKTLRAVAPARAGYTAELVGSMKDLILRIVFDAKSRRRKKSLHETKPLIKDVPDVTRRWNARAWSIGSGRGHLARRVLRWRLLSRAL